MKRNILAAVLLLAFIAYSCTTKEDSSLENPASSVSDLVLVKDGSIVYEPSVMVEDFVLDNEDFPDTKTVLTIGNSGVTFKFANDDKLGVFPYNTTGAPQRLFTLKSSSASSCVFNGNGFALTAGTAYAAYYPFIDNANLAATSVNVSYAGQTQTTAKAPGASDASFNLGGADYLVSHASPVGNECNFKMSHIGALVVMDVTVGQSATYTELSLNSSSASFLQTGTLDLTQNINRPTDGTPTQGIAISSTDNANKMTLALGSGSGIYLTAGSQYRFCMMVPPTNVTGTVTIRLKDDSNVEHIAYVDGKNFKQGYAYRFECTLDTATNFYEDLGKVTANCYIVNTNSVDADGYFFPTTIAGNGIAPDWSSISFADSEDEAYPIGGGNTLTGNGVVVTLNQNGCISDVLFSSNRIYFKATGNKGNAKLTLTNNGTRVWTWHIWCTDQPSTVSITSKTSGLTYAVMDRNMGAYDECYYPRYYYSEAACGLYYPFGSPIGYTVSEYQNGVTSLNSMRHAIALYPERPYLGDSNLIWFNSWGASNYQLPWCLLWGGGSLYNYNNYASKIGSAKTKTMYDPCPVGYKVMTYDVLDGYGDDDSGANGGYYGVSIAGTNGTLFLPYNGITYKEGIRKFDVYLNGYGTLNLETRGWKVNLWTSRYWQNLCPSVYSIELKVSSGTKYQDDTMNGGIKQNGGSENAITIGHGVRCMVGW